MPSVIADLVSATARTVADTVVALCHTSEEDCLGAVNAFCRFFLHDKEKRCRRLYFTFAGFGGGLSVGLALLFLETLLFSQVR